MNKPGNDQSCNKLCRRCLRSCRQAVETLLVDCPRYLPRPFKIEEHRFAQLDLFEASGDKDSP